MKLFTEIHHVTVGIGYMVVSKKKQEGKKDGSTQRIDTPVFMATCGCHRHLIFVLGAPVFTPVSEEESVCLISILRVDFPS